MPKYKQGEVPNCPHCGKALDEPIENFVIPGREGPASRVRSDCGWCDKLFDVEKAGDGAYELTPRLGSA